MSELSNMLNVRVSDEQMQALQVYALQHDASVSEVVRAAIEVLTGAKQ
jgi:predicted HicB family RNase H-like nuclease